MRARDHWVRTVRFLTVSVALFSSGCLLGWQPGVKDYQRAGMVSVPGGLVNAAGGNFYVQRTDIETDTHIGRVSIAASYNTATADWLFNFQTSYDGTTFVDPTGAVHDVTGLSAGDAIPGTVWVYLDATTIKGKGGLRYEFDATGRIDKIRWSNTDVAYLGHEWFANQLVIRGCPGGCQVIYRVTFANGRPVQIADEQSGRTVEYTWNAQNRLEQVKGPLDIAKGWPGYRYEYIGVGLMSAMTNSEGERIEYGYIPSGQIYSVRQIGEGNPTHTFQFLQQNIYGYYPMVHTDPIGRQFRYAIDSERRLVQVFIPSTGQIISQYTWNGLRPASAIRPGQLLESYTYVNDDVATITEPSGNVITYTYEPTATNRTLSGDFPFQTPVLRIDDSLGQVEARTYSPTGMLISIANGAGDTESYTHEVIGQFYTLTRPDGPTKRISNGIWNFYGKPKQGERGFGTGIYENFTYTLAGDRTVGSNGFSPNRPGVVRRSFDENRNLASVTYQGQDEFATPGAEETVVLEYRSDGRLARILRPLGADHELGYDVIGRRTSVSERVDGVLQATTYEYDAAGQLDAVARPNGMREEYDYGPIGNLIEMRLLRDGVLEGTLAMTYDANWLPEVISDSKQGANETLQYDAAGRLEKHTFSQGESITYSYDLRSRKTSEVYSLEGTLPGVTLDPLVTIDYGYDAANRETEIRVDGQTMVDRTYVDGLLSTVLTGNQLERSFSYDPVTGQLDTTRTVDLHNPLPPTAPETVEESTLQAGRVSASGEEPEHFAIVTTTETFYDILVSDARTTQEVYFLDTGDTRGSRVYRWRYDGWQTLLTGQQYNIGYANKRFAYSALGNLQDVEEGPGPQLTGPDWYPREDYTYNAEENRMLQGNGTLFGYDEAGFVNSAGGPGSEAPVLWTADGRMTDWRVGNSLHRSFAWDMRGRATNLYGRDFSRFDGKIEFGGLGGLPSAIDLGDVRIGFEVTVDPVTFEITLGPAGAWARYRHVDFRGNVSFVTDENGAVMQHHVFSPYGIWRRFGPEAGVGADDFRFVGRRSLPNGNQDGLGLLGERMLDPSVRSFLSPDPVLQIANQYTYADGNPVLFSDADGRQAQSTGDGFDVELENFGGVVGGAIGATKGPGGAVLGYVIGRKFGQVLGGIFGDSGGDAGGCECSGPGGPDGPGGPGGPDGPGGPGGPDAGPNSGRGGGGPSIAFDSRRGSSARLRLRWQTAPLVVPMSGAYDGFVVCSPVMVATTMPTNRWIVGMLGALWLGFGVCIWRVRCRRRRRGA